MPSEDLPAGCNKQIRVLARLYCEGLDLLLRSKFLPPAFLLPAEAAPACDPDRIAAFLNALPAERVFSNPDLLYAAMHGGVANRFAPDRGAPLRIFKEFSSPAGLRPFFDDSSRAYSRTEGLERCFCEKSDHFSAFDDKALGAAVHDAFAISYRPLLELQTAGSIFFSKINHAYWEHFLAVHAASYEESAKIGRYRKLNREGLTGRFLASGFDAALASAIRDGVIGGQRIDGTSGLFRLSISFCAGETLSKKLLARPLVPTSRGAIQGALGFFSSVASNWPIDFGDGAEAKKLVDDNMTSAFVDKFVNDMPATMFVVPPHLRKIGVEGYKGTIYRMIIPGRYICETWRVTLPVFVALVQRVRQVHGRVTIITQSGVFAPLLGLALAGCRAQDQDDASLRFFDLGRVLDIAIPEIVARQEWFRRHATDAAKTAQPFSNSIDGESKGLLNGIAEIA